MNQNIQNLARTIRSLVQIPISLLACVILILLGTISFFSTKKRETKPRLVWGSVSIINNSYWSKAMREVGFYSKTFTYTYFGKINNRDDWDWILIEKYKYIPNILKPYVAFIDSLYRFDVFILSAEGYFLGNTPLKYFQAFFFGFFNKKTIIIPYCSDAYVYKNIRSSSLIHGLLMSYPQHARNQTKIDNLVHIAHNVVAGENCAVIALAMVGGSTRIGDNSWIAPSVVLRDGLVIGTNSTVGMGAIVTKNVPDGETWTGNPAKNLTEFLELQKKLKSI